MQSTATRFFFFAVMTLAISSSRPSSAQQPVAAKQMQAPTGPAANMELTDAEAEKVWPVYDRYATKVAKVYDTQIAVFQAYLDSYQTVSGDQAESYLRQRCCGRRLDASPAELSAGVLQGVNR